VNPVQPNLPTYPATKLELFPEVTRQASDPPFDVTRRPKYWADASQAGVDPSQFVQYTVFHEAANGTFVVTTIYMPAGEAATINFPDPTPPNTIPPKLAPKWEAPIRPLLPGEEPYSTPWGLMIKNTNFPNTPVNWTTADQALLQAIAAKLGVGT
jgi:hypothetical protein